MTNPYIRAAAKHPHIREQAQERFSKRPGRPEWVDDKPGKPSTPPGRPETIDVAVIERARNEDGRFKADNPTTPDVDEAWVEIMPDALPSPARRRPQR
jgi:hypothetical protein